MSKEQQELLDEVYKSYYTFMRDDRQWELDKEEFTNKCKTDPEFSNEWGLTIEERELSLKERLNLVSTIIGEEKIRTHEDNLARVDKLNIPRKLITLTYEDKTIESYE